MKTNKNNATSQLKITKKSQNSKIGFSRLFIFLEECKNCQEVLFHARLNKVQI